MWKVYLLMFLVTAFISWLWARGIEKMHKEHPDYKGFDLFNEDEKID